MFDVLRNRAGDARLLPWYKSVQPEDPENSDEEFSQEREESWSPVKTWRVSLLTALLWNMGAFLGLALIFSLVKKRPDANSALHFSPNLPFNTPTTFAPTTSFMSPPSPESNAAWEGLMPDGRGFVLVQNPKEYNLSPGIPTEVGPDRYSVSMFHQLHCLGMIRESYFAASAGRPANIFNEDKLPADQLDHAHGYHVGHCFDYLRQAIQCAGDLTLEASAQSSTGKVLGTVDGWGTTHMCRSWDSALKWTLDHKAPHNAGGIA